MTDSTISSKETIRHECDDYSLANDIPWNQEKPTIEEADKEFIGREIELPFDVGEKIMQDCIAKKKAGANEVSIPKAR